MIRILLATRSVHKAREIQGIIQGSRDVELISLADLGLENTPEEDALEAGSTFLDNARAKASFFAASTGMTTLADDSGLEVAALDNQPGVRTRRFALDAGYTNLTGDALDRANNELLLQKLQKSLDRRARYVCAAVLASPDGFMTAALGTCAGEIARQPQGSGGFGYDPLFLLPELGHTFAELTPQQKNLLSHRARAFRALSTLLK